MKKREVIGGILLFMYFFSIPMNVFWDSAHYMSYVSIFEGTLPWQSWDIVRGIVFPGIIHLSNIIFGKTTQGILFLSFSFYLLMLLGVNLTLKEVLKNKSKKTKKIIYVLVYLWLILDPIIYGYYHALLTEFVAMSISVIMCYLSWKWIDIDFFKNKKKYIIYTIIFAISTALSWHLKQPYVTVTIFPILIASILSIIKNHDLKNIIGRIISFSTCILILVGSIVGWNQFLKSKDIDLNTNRNVTVSFGNQLMVGLNNYQLEQNFTEEVIDNSKYLSKDEKKKLLKNPDKYVLINIYNPSDKLVDQTYLSINSSNNVSTSTSISFILGQAFKHPYLVLESYLSSYLAIANLYPKVTTDNVSYDVSKELTLDYCHENCAIAFSVSVEKSNLSYMLDDAYQRVVNYEQYNDSPVVLRYLLKGLSYISNILYKLFFVLLPFMVVAVTISFIKHKHNKFLELSMILLWYSLLHILVHVATGANIDRYASPSYITMGLAFIMYIYYIINGNILKKNFKRGRKIYEKRR